MLLATMALSLCAVAIIIVSSYCLQFHTLRFYSLSLLLLCFCMLAQGIVFLLDLDSLSSAATACSISLLFLKTTIYTSFALLSALSSVMPRHIKLSVARAATGAACVCAVRAYSQYADSFSLGGVCADAFLLLFYVVLLLLERWPECDFELRAPAHLWCIVQLCTIPLSLLAHVLGLVGSDGAAPPRPLPPLPPPHPPAGLLPCACFAAAAVAAVADMVIVPLAFHRCIVADTRLLLSNDLSDDGPSSQHARLLQVRGLHT